MTVPTLRKNRILLFISQADLINNLMQAIGMINDRTIIVLDIRN
jgi:hypothetical protein